MHNLQGSWPSQYWMKRAYTTDKEIILKIIIKNILFDFFNINLFKKYNIYDQSQNNN